jgi:hypothetical protein
MPSTAGYDAFISYSRLEDGWLAPALQSGLERFAKPWYRLRGLRVFRDKATSPPARSCGDRSRLRCAIRAG